MRQPEILPKKVAFARCLLVGFVFAIGAGLCGTNWLNRRFDFSQLNPFAPPGEAYLSGANPYVNYSIRLADTAKKRQYLWANFNGSVRRGAAVDFLGHPEMFADVYPGYPDSMRFDAELWRSYFSTTFNHTVYSTLLENRFDQKWLVYQSWVGCMDIYKKYGADILTFGSSQFARSFVPAEMAKAFSGSPRILSCARHNIWLEDVAATADFLAQTGQRKAKAAVLGYGYLFARPKNEDSVKESRKFFEEYQDHFRQTDWWHRKLSEYFPAFTWHDIVGLSYQEYSVLRQKAAEDRFVDERTAQKPAEINAGNWQNQAELREVARRYFAKSPRFEEDPLTPCDAAQISRDLRRAVDQLLRVAEHVFIYLIPSGMGGKTDTCLVRGYREALLSVRSERVHVRWNRLEDYGVNWSDFVNPNGDGKDLRLDVSHFNYFGAVKVTRSIGAWIRSEWERGSR